MVSFKSYLVYLIKFSIAGTVSIMSMVVIGYDRYNVIVKGFSGTKITPCIAFSIIVCIWLYSIAACCPPFIGWGGYALGNSNFLCYFLSKCLMNFNFSEGLFVTCSYDYLSEDWNKKSFVIYAFVFNYCVPIAFVIFFYSQIVHAVVAHESALKAQAKKMNVDSLRSNQVFV